jgi:hypothetical protein
MKNIVTGARVYRFGDRVALNIRLPDGPMETVYIDSSVAMDLATLLHDAALDIHIEPDFSASDFGTHNVVPCNDGVFKSRIERA